MEKDIGNRGFGRRGLRGLAAAIALCGASTAAAQDWTFESGSLLGWTRTGTAFERQPTYGNNVATRRPGESPSHVGDWWIGTFEARPGPGLPAGAAQGDEPIGTLLSPFVTLSRPYIQFLIGGGADITRLRVELLIEMRAGETAALGGPISLADGVYSVRASATGNNAEAMRREQWDVRAYFGRKARIRVIDNASGAWGHINVDDFRSSDAAIAPIATVVPGARVGVRSAYYRVVARGFRVNRPSGDDGDGDGRGDEVYVRGDAFELDRNGTLAARSTARTEAIGHRTFLQGGSGQPEFLSADDQLGGFFRGDTYPSRNPSVGRGGPPRPNDLPLTIWEGELTQGANAVVVIPTIWEWDGPTANAEEARWDAALAPALAGQAARVQALVRQGGSTRSMPVFYNMLSVGVSDEGTRPIGSPRRQVPALPMPVAAIVLTFDSAQDSANAIFYDAPVCTETPDTSSCVEDYLMPQGVVRLSFSDPESLQGIYTLYVFIERLR